MQRVGTAADDQAEQPLAVLLLLTDLRIGCRGDDGPGQLRQPVPHGDQAGLLQAAHGRFPPQRRGSYHASLTAKNGKLHHLPV